MPSRSYGELISQAKLNFEFWRGDIQNKGAFSTGTFTITGSPRINKINQKTFGLRQTVINDGIISGAVSSVIDCTQAFWCECIFKPFDSISFYFMRQLSAGGWQVYWDGSAKTVVVFTATAVSGNARWAYSLNSSLLGDVSHVVAHLDTSALTSYFWTNNIPMTTTFANVGVPANCSSVLLSMGTGGPSGNIISFRIWQGTPTQEEVTTLYQNYRNLTVPSKA